MIYRLRDLIPPSDVQQQTQEGLWVAAQELPFYDGIVGRLGAAWSVFRERARAVSPPMVGEFEIAMQERGWNVKRSDP